MLYSWAPNTKNALFTEYKTFKAYCRLAHIDTLPIPGHHLAL